MKEMLAVGMLQADLLWQSPVENRERLGKLLSATAAGLDLVLLPEAFTTGFTRAAPDYAEPIPGPTLAWMAEQANAHQVTLAGSFLVREQGAFFNRLVWMQPSGDFGHYDKRHLFSMAGENDVFSAGHQRAIFNCQGWRCCPMICYDLRFPVWSRSLGDYDMLCYVANWPDPRVSQWQKLLAARAIENQAYVAGVNRVGRDPNGCIYSGSSQFYDPLGEVMGANGGGEAMLRADFSASRLQELRTRFPVLNDADRFSLIP